MTTLLSFAPSREAKGFGFREIRAFRGTPFRAFRVFRGSILTLAFLEGCQRAGLFEAIAMEGAAP